MTNSTSNEAITKAPIIFTVSDASSKQESAPSPLSTASTASTGAAEDEHIWKTVSHLPQLVPFDQYHRRYNTIQPVAPAPVPLFEKRHEEGRGRLPPYLKQMHRQASEAPSEAPSMRSTRSRRSRSTPKKSRFFRSLHYVGSHHRHYGLRHIVLVLTMTIAWLLGALVFWAIEAPAEKAAVADTYVQLSEAFRVLAADLHETSKTTNASDMSGHLKTAYLKLLNIEGKYKWSTLHKIESSPEGTYQWTFGSAFFFTNTLFTTVGYGTIYPSTDLSRWIVIVFSCFFYPFCLVIIRDIGQLILLAMTRIYAKLLIKIRTARGFLTTEWESISLPYSINLAVSFIFIILAGVFFHYYDCALGPDEGMTHFQGFYFSFLSYTLIGLGDIMPVNEPYSPLIIILVTVGLPLMRVITKATIFAIENGYFATMLYVENKLDGKVTGKEEMKTEVQVEKSVHGDSSDDDDDDDDEKKARDELMNNFTIQSLAKFMTSGRDVYNGEYGRVELRKSDL